MKTLLLATHNAHKVEEFRAILASLAKDTGKDYRVLSFRDVPDIPEVEETGTTFAANALLKAEAGAKSGYITIADDSGLSVDALGGAPGIFSARYAGGHGDDEANNQKLLAEMQGKTERGAHYVCAVACVFPDGRHFTVEGTCEGEILTAPRGSAGFGYDPLFLIPGTGQTFAEMTADEKNARSHRTVALKRFVEKIQEYL